MAGEILGLDGIGTEKHTCNAVALEDSEVCVIPFSDLENYSREIGALQHHFHKVMSREIVRDHGVMMLLGIMRAEERLAAEVVRRPVDEVEAGEAPVGDAGGGGTGPAGQGHGRVATRGGPAPVYADTTTRPRRRRKRFVHATASPRAAVCMRASSPTTA